MIDSIIFDMDGTLWDSTPEVAIAYNKVVKERYPEITDTVTVEKLKGLFGLPLDVIGVKLFQSIPEEQARKAIMECCDYEEIYLAEHGAFLYEGLEETLKELSKKYKLYIVSNCQDGYIQCFFKAYPHLEQYFLDFECHGSTGLMKTDNIRLIADRHSLKNPVYVGDTLGDANASREAGVPFVYARYGFGEVKDFDYVIDSFSELTKKFG